MMEQDMTEYRYWEIEYVSCESNDRHTVARAPSSWEEYDVRSNIPMGGCGDDVAEVISVSEVSQSYYKYGWDFTT